MVPAFPPWLGGQTLLDASGFVVAQRQATVSAKISGRVIDFSVSVGAR